MPKEVLNVKYLLHLGSFDVSLTILYMFYHRFSIIQSMIHYKLNLLLQTVPLHVCVLVIL